MVEQTRADEQAQRMAARQVQDAGTSSSAATTAPGSANESYWAYMVCTSYPLCYSTLSPNLLPFCLYLRKMDMLSTRYRSKMDGLI